MLSNADVAQRPLNEAQTTGPVYSAVPGKSHPSNIEGAPDYTPISALSDEEIAAQVDRSRDPARRPILEEMTDAQKRSRAAREISEGSTKDPLGLGGGQPMSLSGRADPLFAAAGVAIGDRVYNKLKKKEGQVKDVAASGKIHVKYDDGLFGWANSENIIKL